MTGLTTSWPKSATITVSLPNIDWDHPNAISAARELMAATNRRQIEVRGVCILYEEVMVAIQGLVLSTSRVIVSNMLLQGIVLWSLTLLK